MNGLTSCEHHLAIPGLIGYGVVGDDKLDPDQSRPITPDENDEVWVAKLVPDEPAFSPSAAPRRRIWTSLATVAISLFSILIASLVMRGLAIWVLGTEPLSLEQFVDEDGLRDALKSRLGLFLMVVVPQFGLVVPSLLAAMLSPVPFRERLGLVRGHWPAWAWIAVAAMTPLVGLASTIFSSMFMQESESLREMSEIFRTHGQGGFLVPLALMIGATPALCEELLFRGYLQTRLTRSLRPSIGIVFASVVFAAFHMDYVHALGVLPLGLFLGWVSWQSGSLFPAMLGHFVNNALSVLMISFAADIQPESVPLTAIAAVLAILACGMMGVVGVVIAAVLYGSPIQSHCVVHLDPIHS